MRKLVALSVLFVWFVGIGCQQKQQVDHLKAGRGKLLNAGLALEAVEPLKKSQKQKNTTKLNREPY